MEWVFFSAYIVTFIACAYVIYRRIEEVSEEVDELQRDIKRNEKLLGNYKKENRPIEYIVELKNGVYLQENIHRRLRKGQRLLQLVMFLKLNHMTIYFQLK